MFDSDQNGFDESNTIQYTAKQQEEIRNLAEEAYRIRLDYGYEGSEKEDWQNAEWLYCQQNGVMPVVSQKDTLTHRKSLSPFLWFIPIGLILYAAIYGLTAKGYVPFLEIARSTDTEVAKDQKVYSPQVTPNNVYQYNYGVDSDVRQDGRYFNAILNNYNFNGQNIERFEFMNAELNFATFRNSGLTSSSFMNAEMQKTDFRGATLNNVRFMNANLEDADFTNATLNNVDFMNANLKGADFRGVDLEKVDFMNAKNLDDALF